MRSKESDEPLLLPRFYFFALFVSLHCSPLSERLEQVSLRVQLGVRVGRVTVQGDAKVTLYLTGLDGTAVNLVARTNGLALPPNGLKLAFLIIEG